MVVVFSFINNNNNNNNDDDGDDDDDDGSHDTYLEIDGGRHEDEFVFH